MTELKAPRHLRATTRAWWASVCGEYELEGHHLKLLTMAAEAWDRCTQARQAIQEHGITYKDRFGSPRARPEVAIERDARIAFSRLIRELDLDIAPPTSASRAPALVSNRNRRRA